MASRTVFVEIVKKSRIKGGPPLASSVIWSDVMWLGSRVRSVGNITGKF